MDLIVRTVVVCSLILATAWCFTRDDCPSDLPRDDNLMLYGTSCYYFMLHSSHDHATAQRSCSAIGGRLSIIRDNSTQLFLQSNILGHFQHKGPVWIGLTNAGHSTSYTWESGAAVQYTHWAQGQPPSVNNGCVAMETSQGGAWMVYPCHLEGFADIRYPFVCEFPLTSSCRRCGDIGTRTPCSDLDLVFAPFSKCPDDTPYCMNDIYRTDSQTDVYKRCVDKDTCHRVWYLQSSHNPLCLAHDLNGQSGQLECHLCCYGDRCNSALSPPPDSLYRPDGTQNLAGSPTSLTTANTATNLPTTLTVTHTSAMPTTANFIATSTTTAGTTQPYPTNITSASGGSVKASTCFTCGDFDNKRPCTRIEIIPRHPVQCPDDKAYCMNDIYQETGRNASVYKRCVDLATCNQQWYIESSDKVSCFRYDPHIFKDDLVCHLCCHGDECNRELLPPESTRYKP